MSVGVPALDADHRCLIRIVNLLHDIKNDRASHETVQTALDTLKLYGRMHFQREERIMEAFRFPGAAFHGAEHKGFAKHIDTLRRAFGKRNDPKTAVMLVDYLTGWLRHHILIQDMAYKPYVSDHDMAEEVARGVAPGMPNVVGLSAPH